MQALPSGQMINMHSFSRVSRELLRALALVVFVVPVFGQGAAIEPCQATPTPAKPGSTQQQQAGARTSRIQVDESIPGDKDVEKMLAPYSEKIGELSKVIGRLEGDLSKTGVGGGSLGNFVTNGVKAQAEAKLGKPVSLAVMNIGGLRKNAISAGELRASDIFE